MKKGFIGLIAHVLLGLSSLANAAYIVNTGQPDGTFGGYTLGAYALGEGPAIYNQRLAGKFTTTDVKTITSAEGWIGGGNDEDPKTATVGIFSDTQVNFFGTSMNVPGSALFSSEFTVSTYASGWYGGTGLSWELSAGTYWLVFEVTGDDTLNGWMSGVAPSPLNSYANWNNSYNDGISRWRTDGIQNPSEALGMRIGIADPVEGGNVPEPESLALFGAALAGLGLTRRKAKQA